MYLMIDRSVSHNGIESVEFTTIEDPVSARPEHITEQEYCPGYGNNNQFDSVSVNIIHLC
jgi:hypothetical protein